MPSATPEATAKLVPPAPGWPRAGTGCPGRPDVVRRRDRAVIAAAPVGAPGAPRSTSPRDVNVAVAAADGVGDDAGPAGLVGRARARRRCRRGSTR